MHGKEVGGTGGSLIALVRRESFLLRAACLQALLGKANFNPSQPRAPRGGSDGGRWVDEGREGAQPRKNSPRRPLLASHDDFPEIPKKLPDSARERHGIARRLAGYMARNSMPLVAIVRLARVVQLLNDGAYDIIAYLDDPKPLETLRWDVYEPKKGYDVHHIVEQTAARRDGFPDAMIETRENKVRIPRFKHWEINAWYGSPNEDYGGLTPREYLRGRSWEERMTIGLNVLIKYGVMNP